MNKKGILDNLMDNLAAFVLILLAALFLIIPIQANIVFQNIEYEQAMQDVHAQKQLNDFLRSSYADKTIAEHIARRNTEIVFEQARTHFSRYGLAVGFVIKYPDEQYPVGFHPTIVSMYQEIGTAAQAQIPSKQGSIAVSLLISSENTKLEQEHQTIMEN